MLHQYQLFGLAINSEFELRNCQTSPFDGPGDLVISSSPELYHETGKKNFFKISSQSEAYLSNCDEFILRISYLGHFVVSFCTFNVTLYLGGRILTIQNLVEVSTLLQDFLMEVVLIKRGYLTLHANAILGNKGIVCCVGPSGSGKSTTSLFLNDQGYKIVSDELVAVTLKNSKWVVYSGLPYIKSWSKSFTLIGIDYADLERVNEGIDKYYFQIKNKFQGWGTITNIVMLSDDEIELDDLINFSVSRPYLLDVLADNKEQFEAKLSSIMSEINIKYLKNFESINELLK